MLRSCILSGFFLFSSLAFAAEPQDVISQAREIFLEGNRRAALLRLEAELQVLKPGDAKYKKLASEQRKIAERFVTDAGQKEYELAESLYFSNRQGSRNQYLEALKLEPDNGEILVSLVIEALHEKDCDAAQERIRQIEELWSTYSGLSLLKLRLNQCLGLALTTDEIKAAKSIPEGKPYTWALEAQQAVEKSSGVKGSEKTNLSTKTAGVSSYPEDLYWAYRLGELSTDGDVELLKRYIVSCQSVTELQRRQFRFDPFLCQRFNEAQELIKSKEKEKEAQKT